MTTRVHKIIVIGGATLLALALSAALLRGQTSGAPTTSASYVPPSDSMSGQSMLEINIRANREAIQQAQVTVGGTRSSDTRRFAESLISDHTAVMSQATALWDRLNYTRPDSSSTTVPMAPDSSVAMGAGAVSGDEVDRGYATTQVSALESLATRLKQHGPAVRDRAVRAFALDLQATIDRELAAARQLAAPRPAPARPAGP